MLLAIHRLDASSSVVLRIVSIGFHRIGLNGCADPFFFFVVAIGIGSSLLLRSSSSRRETLHAVFVLREVFTGSSSSGDRHAADPLLSPSACCRRLHRFVVLLESAPCGLRGCAVQSSWSICHGFFYSSSFLDRYRADPFFVTFFFGASACSRSFFKPFGMRPKASSSIVQYNRL